MVLPVVFILVFVFFAPVGYFALPFAGIIWTAGGRRGRATTAALAAGLGLWWLLQVGDPPDQLARAVAVLAAVAYVGLTMLTRLSVTHRSLVSTVLAGGAGASLLAVLGRSWESVRWWVEYRAGYTAQVVLSGMWAAVPRTPDGLPQPGQDRLVLQAEDWFNVALPWLGDLYPGLMALQLMGGLALAAFVAHRLGVRSLRAPGPSRFVDFRFTEHLGWAAVVALGAVLLLSEGTVRLAAANVLLVAAVLYGVRGAAVAWFGVTLRGGPTPLVYLVLAISILFLLPAIAVWSIVVGVADSGLDLRKRWTTPKVRE
jgi:Predicted membrane protein (DUF2232)